jgi:putative effector of murein hydrolase
VDLRQNGETLVIGVHEYVDGYIWIRDYLNQLSHRKTFKQKIPQIPLIVFAMFIVIGLLAILGIPYEHYMNNVNGVFNHLLGYVLWL